MLPRSTRNSGRPWWSTACSLADGICPGGFVEVNRAVIWRPALIVLGIAAVAMTASCSPESSLAADSRELSTAFIPKGAVWRYLDTGSAAASGWRLASFDDSAWKQGAAELGYGDGDEATVVNSGPSGTRYITT